MTSIESVFFVQRNQFPSIDGSPCYPEFGLPCIFLPVRLFTNLPAPQGAQHFNLVGTPRHLMAM